MERKWQSADNSDQSVGPAFPEASQPSESLFLCKKKAQKYNGFYFFFNFFWAYYF